MKPELRDNKFASKGQFANRTPPLLAISPWMVAGFHRIARRRLAGSFRAVRIAHPLRAAELPKTEPLVVYLNHPSWWDPLVGFVVARFLFGTRRFYAPMESVALERYRIFRRLGMFPVDMATLRGAAQFLHSGQAVLDAGHILAVTPQGEFTDVRKRPVRLRSGLAALLARRQQSGQSTVVLPIALEYTFWDQRLPEVLLQCGTPLRFAGSDAPAPRAQIGRLLEDALSSEQDELALLAERRDPAEFAQVLHGSTGSAGFYGLLEKARGFLGRKEPIGDHQSRPFSREAEQPLREDSHEQK